MAGLHHPQHEAVSKCLLLLVAVFYASYFQDLKNKKAEVQPQYQINLCLSKSQLHI